MNLPRRKNVSSSLVGSRFGRLVVVAERKEKYTDTMRTFCICQCDCGNEYKAPKHQVAAGKKQTCGCLLLEIRHGMSHKSTNNRPPRMYTVWRGIRARCTCESATGYENYGARGITVCERWDSFRNFRDDILALLPNGTTDIPSGLDVDRIDNEGNYEPGNVQFSTRSDNLSHRRGNVFFTINGETKTLTQWCRHFGITPSCYRHRVKLLGWDAERALSTPKSSPRYWPRKGATPQ